MLNGFLNMKNIKVLPCKVYKKKFFWGVTFACCMDIICLDTPTKSSVVVILKGRPSFYDNWLIRYGFCDFFPCPSYFRAISG